MSAKDQACKPEVNGFQCEFNAIPQLKKKLAASLAVEAWPFECGGEINKIRKLGCQQTKMNSQQSNYCELKIID